MGFETVLKQLTFNKVYIFQATEALGGHWEEGGRLKQIAQVGIDMFINCIKTTYSFIKMIDTFINYLILP